MSKIILITLVLIVSCGRPVSSSLSNDQQIRPIAEYEPIKGVFFGTGFHRWAEHDQSLPENQRIHFLKRAEEYLQLMRTVSSALPQLQYYIHSGSEEWGANGHSEIAAWKPHIERLAQTTKASFDLFEFTAEDFPEHEDYRRFEDEWVRDYGPIQFKQDDQVILSYRKSRGELTNKYLANKMNHSARHIEKAPEGGNFMATRNSFCAMAARTEDDGRWNLDLMKNSLNCDRLIILDALPNEGTGHIDLFAKFVKDDVVVISKYETNDVEIEKNLRVFEYQCTPNQIAQSNWSECSLVKERGETIPTPKSGVFVSESEAKQFESQYFGDATRSPYLHADLVAFLQKTHNVFSSHGFQVVAIPAPRPKVAYAKIIYRHEPSQAVVRTELVRDYVHRSYTNSLIANGYVFMPSYESAKTVTELVAEKTYRDLGFIVRTVNMSESIKAGGAVHCLSMGLH